MLSLALMRRLLLLTAAGVAAAATAAAQHPDIASGEQLLAAMHDRYAATWYPTLTFVQKSIWYKPDGSEARVQTWHEALAAPGKLRIDMGEAARRDGAIYANDSSYRFANGKLTAASTEGNPLLILGFDVYRQPAERTAAQLRGEGIDLTKIHRDTFHGRPVYVVGAAPGDSTAHQFWVDADRMLFVRLIEPGRNNGWQDIRFDKYVPEPGGWLADRVQLFANGKLAYEEDYSDVRVNVKLDPELWNPKAWATVKLWWQ